MRAYVYVEKSICRCLVVELYLTLRNPMDCSTPGFLVLHHLPEFAQTQSTESVMPCNLLIFCFPFLLSPSIFPSIRVFSSQSALHIRWPKDCSFRSSPSSACSGSISFRIDSIMWMFNFTHEKRDLLQTDWDVFSWLLGSKFKLSSEFLVKIFWWWFSS